MPEHPAVEARHVSRIYRSPAGSTEALHEVDVSFPAGAISALVGPSGSGKSTLLRLLAGVDRPDSGSVVVDGIDLSGLTHPGVRRYQRLTAAYVAQRAAAGLVPHLTVAEQLGRHSAEAETLGIAHRLPARATELSGGEQARAALAVALSRGTPVLFLDEPTAELDRHAAALVIGALQRIADAGRTVVVATHDQDLIARAANTVDLSPLHAHVPRTRRTRLQSGRQAVIAATHLTKDYDGTRAVDGATLSIAPGELAVLLGRSGSGKSTLLMLLGGFLSADAGELATPGQRWHETAYLAQRFGLLAELTIGENVDLPHRLGDAPPSDALGQLELDALVGRLPTEVSVGQQQRAALARALAARPQALLADEPTSHQDAASAERVWDALAKACAEGTACLVATHDEDAASRADRVWRIEDGRIVGGDG